MSAVSMVSFETIVAAEAAGAATADELAVLADEPARWRETLVRLVVETDAGLAQAGRWSGRERDQVVSDLREERASLAKALVRAGGAALLGGDPEGPEDEPASGPPVLQASWAGTRVVLWAGGPGMGTVGHDVMGTVGHDAMGTVGHDDLGRLIDEAGAASVERRSQGPVALPDGRRAPACWAEVGDILGWLVAVAGGQAGPEVAPSVRWLAEVAAWGTELAAAGRVVPTLHRVAARSSTRPGSASFAVRWVPALIDPVRLGDLGRRMPGSVAVLQPAAEGQGLCRAVLAAVVSSIGRVGAQRLVAPAVLPGARNRAELSTAVLAHLGGSPIEAAPVAGDELARDLKRWAQPVLAVREVGLVLRLDPPQADGGWLLSVEVTGVERHPVALAQALDGPPGKARATSVQLDRLERLLPALSRASARRRGQVVMGPEEAWALMTDSGRALQAAGFEVQAPVLTRGRPQPRLRLTTEIPAGPSKVGAQQLCRVRWSVLFDDVELDARDIGRLAKEARPLVRARGRWVELDRTDLVAAAAALAAQEQTTTLSGGAVLRHALGLEGSPLGGPVSVQGEGWAAELLHRTTGEPPEPLGAPAGFVGELRAYQAAARGWLAFLDHADLGGCLAMDMGLGKTPTVLAHLLATRAQGPVLVVAPPAVLGNWGLEAARFAPSLSVLTHHGPGRRRPAELRAAAADVDLVLTTYATAVRDVDALAVVEWDRIVVDEAQAIKNPASDTAQALRQLRARSRLALTGTPVENGLSDLWAILDFTNPGLVGPRRAFVDQLSKDGDDRAAAGESALAALNGLLVFRRTKAEPVIAAELPDKIDELDHCPMTPEQIGLYQAVLDRLMEEGVSQDKGAGQARVLAAITALKQICNHPEAYLDEDGPLSSRSGKLARLEAIVDAVMASGERVLVFTHFARWGERLARHLTSHLGQAVECYHGGLSRSVRDRLVAEFQESTGPGVLVLSLKAGGSGLNLTGANHVVLYDRWWNPAVEDQARDRAWRIGQTRGVVCHRLVCPGTVDDRVEEVVAGKRRIADLVLPRSSSLADLGPDQLRAALGLRPDALLEDDMADEEETAA